MAITRTRRGTAGRAASAHTSGRDPATGVAPLIALQRSAGNSSTVALLHRANESPITLTIPGVVDRAAVSSWSIGNGPHPTDLNLERPIDSDSPRLFRAVTNGAGATATIVMRKLTPLGWIHSLTLTLEGCMVSSYQLGEKDESVGLTFTGTQVEQ